MGLRVNTNLASMTAQRNLSNVSMRLEGNYRRLASGLRIQSASDDAAGLGISERMRSRIRSLSQAGRNAQDGISLVQTAEGALAEVNNNLNRMRELAIQSANGTLTSDDRAALNVEFQALISEIDRIAATTEFNGIDLLDADTGNINMQVGVDDSSTFDVIQVDLDSATITSLQVSTIAVSGTAADSALTALTFIDTAINSVNTARGKLGSVQNRLDSAFRSIGNVRENLSAAESRIRDVDIAAETADLTRNGIMQQAAVSVLSQANAQPQIALSLLQG